MGSQESVSLSLPIKSSQITSFISPVGFFSEKASLRDLSKRTDVKSIFLYIPSLLGIYSEQILNMNKPMNNLDFFCLLWLVLFACWGFLVPFLSFLDCYHQGT